MSKEELQKNDEQALNEAVDQLASIFVQFLDEIEAKKKEDINNLFLRELKVKL